MKSIKKIYSLYIFLLTINGISAQVGVGTTTPHPSALLDIFSNSKGFLLPRMTQNNILAIEAPAIGLMVYCTDCQNKGLQYYDGVSWRTAGQKGNNPKPIITNTLLDFTSTLIGSKLMTFYNYNANGSGPENVESVVYKWYRANDNLGNEALLITGATSKNYTITNADVGKWIASEVIVSSVNGDVSNGAISEFIPAQFIFEGQTYSAVRGVYDSPDPNTVGDYIWIDRNLGASQVANSANDENAYGDYYQWGRGKDGHQLATSLTTTSLATSIIPSNSNFIRSTTSEWTTTRQDSLWVTPNYINNVCPAGFKVPEASVFENERIALGISNNATVFNNRLKLTNAGYRSNSNGQFTSVGVNSYYWTTTISSGSPYGINHIAFDSNGGGFVSSSFLSKASGICVRCILK